MRHDAMVGVVIPALDEGGAIGMVLGAIPAWVDHVIVVDNGSADDTAARAREGGARVVRESRRGYGNACRRGMAELEAADIIVFLDADYSDFPEEMHRLVDPIAAGTADLVLGARRDSDHHLPWHQRAGNSLACALMRWFWGVRYTDLGPFRAIRAPELRALGMRDPNFGWTVEMQIKAARRGLGIEEVPVRYRTRIGTSKISGSILGSLRAGAKILAVIAHHALLTLRGCRAWRARASLDSD